MTVCLRLSRSEAECWSWHSLRSLLHDHAARSAANVDSNRVLPNGCLAAAEGPLVDGGDNRAYNGSGARRVPPTRKESRRPAVRNMVRSLKIDPAIPASRPDSAPLNLRAYGMAVSQHGRASRSPPVISVDRFPFSHPSGSGWKTRIIPCGNERGNAFGRNIGDRKMGEGGWRAEAWHPLSGLG